MKCTIHNTNDANFYEKLISTVLFQAILFIFLPVVLPQPINNEYKISISQDKSGNYRITYHRNDFSKVEERHCDGTLFGVYYYNDINGNQQTITYIAGNRGLRVISSAINALSNHSTANEDPKEKEKHAEELKRAIDDLEGKLAKIRPLAPFTPEAVKVTIQHLKAVEIAKIAAKQGGYADCVLLEIDSPNLKTV